MRGPYVILSLLIYPPPPPTHVASSFHYGPQQTLLPLPIPLLPHRRQRRATDNRSPPSLKSRDLSFLVHSPCLGTTGRRRWRCCGEGDSSLCPPSPPPPGDRRPYLPPRLLAAADICSLHQRRRPSLLPSPVSRGRSPRAAALPPTAAPTRERGDGSGLTAASEGGDRAPRLLPLSELDDVEDDAVAATPFPSPGAEPPPALLVAACSPPRQRHLHLPSTVLGVICPPSPFPPTAEREVGPAQGATHAPYRALFGERRVRT